MKTILRQLNIKNGFIAISTFSLLLAGSASASSTAVIACEDLSTALASSTIGDSVYVEGGCTLGGYPVLKDECKNGGWLVFQEAAFKNQGECISYLMPAKTDPYDDVE